MSIIKAQSIDEVIAFLDIIVEESKTNKNPSGYFAALYRKVTIRVKEGILNGEFNNAERMEKLDVVFANRYLEAYSKFNKDENPTQSWLISFNKTEKYWPIVLQHLLLGMNAHINLDLGIAAAQTAADSSISDLKEDFDQINTLLAELVKDVEQELSQIWPLLHVLLYLAGKVDKYLVNFSMKQARDGAWKFANELHYAKREDWNQMILARDIRISEIASYIDTEGYFFKFLFRLIRIGERGNVRRRIEILE